MPEQQPLALPFAIPENAVPIGAGKIRVALVDNRLVLSALGLTQTERRHLRLKVQTIALGYGVLNNAYDFGLGDAHEAVYTFEATPRNLRFLQDMAPLVSCAPLTFIDRPEARELSATWYREPRTLVAASGASPLTRAVNTNGLVSSQELPEWATTPPRALASHTHTRAPTAPAARRAAQAALPAPRPKWNPSTIRAEYAASESYDELLSFFLVLKKIPKAGPGDEYKQQWQDLQTKLPVQWITDHGWALPVTLDRAITPGGAPVHTPSFTFVAQVLSDLFGVTLEVPQDRNVFVPERDLHRSGRRVLIPNAGAESVSRDQVLSISQSGMLWVSVPVPGRTGFVSAMLRARGMWFPWLCLWRVPVAAEFEVRRACLATQGNAYDPLRGWVSLRNDLNQEIGAYQIPLADAKRVLEKVQCPFQQSSLFESVVHLRADLAQAEALRELSFRSRFYDKGLKYDQDAESLEDTLYSTLFQLDPAEREMLPEVLQHYNKGGCPACKV